MFTPFRKLYKLHRIIRATIWWDLSLSQPESHYSLLLVFLRHFFNCPTAHSNGVTWIIIEQKLEFLWRSQIWDGSCSSWFIDKKCEDAVIMKARWWWHLYPMKLHFYFSSKKWHIYSSLTMASWRPSLSNPPIFRDYDCSNNMMMDYRLWVGVDFSISSIIYLGKVPYTNKTFKSDEWL